MKVRTTILTSVFLAAGLAHGASLLVNGDFTAGEDRVYDPVAPGNGQLAVGWVQTSGGGWNNREINGNGLAPDNYHLALGTSDWGFADNVAYQNVPASEGLLYRFSVDAGNMDGWWHPHGEAKMVFLDGGSVELDSASVLWGDDAPFDTPLPWQNYSVTSEAPAGTTQVTVYLMNQWGNNGGGTMRFDNAALEVVPEPGATMLLGLGSILLLGRRSRRSRA